MSNGSADELHQGKGSRPIPDPTILTTQQLNREISALKEIISTRLDAMDKALEVFTTNLNRVPSEVDMKVNALKDLLFERITRFDEKFHSVEVRFAERDVRFHQASEAVADATRQAASASGAAVSAALDAAEKAVTKSEIATLKLLDQQAAQVFAQSRSHDSQIDDIKGRLIRIEEGRVGQKAAVETSQTNYSNTVGMVGLILGALLGVGGLAMGLMANDNTTPPPKAVIVESSKPVLNEQLDAFIDELERVLQDNSGQ